MKMKIKVLEKDSMKEGEKMENLMGWEYLMIILIQKYKLNGKMEDIMAKSLKNIILAKIILNVEMEKSMENIFKFKTVGKESNKNITVEIFMENIVFIGQMVN